MYTALPVGHVFSLLLLLFMGRHAAHKSIWFRYVGVLNDATANTAAAAAGGAIDITELLYHAAAATMPPLNAS